MQYYARRFYNDLLLSTHEEKGSVDFFIISDRTRPIAAQLKASLLDFEGHPSWSKQEDVVVTPLHSKAYLTVPIETLLAVRNAKSAFLVSELVVDGKVVSSNEHYFEPFKKLLLPRPQISAQAVPTRVGFRITLSSDKLARTVYLSAPDQKGFFVDNYFDLIPGRKVEVEYRTREAARVVDFQKNLRIRSLVDAF